MINSKTFVDSLRARGVSLFAGVPDSLLSSFCAYLQDQSRSGEYVITANEGNAVALAAGFHLSTGKVGAVYLQNSGLGNTINPLTSLADGEVYRIPMLLIIGWRGEPGIKDEPQHVKQGRVTLAQLALLEVPYWILDGNSDLDQVLHETFAALSTNNCPVALLVRKDTFSTYKGRPMETEHIASLKREEALRHVLALGRPNDLVVSTTGKTSREVFELRVERGEAQRDFLTVGSMGHASSLALGVALGNPGRRVVCLDGDGSALMHLGALPIIGSLKPTNLIHVLLNNAAHESVGGQPTVGAQVDFRALAMASGYRAYHVATNVESLQECLRDIESELGPVLLEIKIMIGSRDNLGRPTSLPEENKRTFMAAAGL